MFADYRVPQVLVHFDAMVYDEYLMELLSQGRKATTTNHKIRDKTNISIISCFFFAILDKILDNGSPEEVEIRGTSIFVVEELKKAVLAELETNYPNVPRTNVNSILLDHFLWDYRRRFARELEHIPFHKTISIYY